MKKSKEDVMFDGAVTVVAADMFIRFTDENNVSPCDRKDAYVFMNKWVALAFIYGWYSGMTLDGQRSEYASYEFEIRDARTNKLNEKIRASVVNGKRVFDMVTFPCDVRTLLGGGVIDPRGFG